MTDNKKNTGDRNTGDRNTGDWNTGDRNTGDGNTGNRNTGDGNTGNRNTGDRNTGDWNTGDWNTGDWNTGDGNTGDRNTGDGNTGNRNTGYCNTGDSNTGNRNIGYSNTGNWNTGNGNTGYCNTITPEDVLIFNKVGKRQDWLDIDKPNWMFVSLTSWVCESDMSDKEKEAYPTYTTTGGYLKCYTSLKHAYIEAWEKADKEDRDKTFNLPNFDPIVFQKIFGFNPCDCVEEKREHIVVEQDIIEINGVTEKHTKPWRVQKLSEMMSIVEVRDANDKVVLAENPDVCEHIVKCVNMHDVLVEGLRVIKVDAQDTLKIMSDNSPAAKLALQHIEKIATDLLNRATKGE